MKDTIAKWGDMLESKVQQVAEGVSEYAYNEVRDKTPVRTGFARDSWTKDEGNRVIEIRNTADYITYLEYGSATVDSHGMVSTTMPALEDEANRIIEGL